MVTDRPPRAKALLTKFAASDQLGGLPLPGDDRMRLAAAAIEAAMKGGARTAVQGACAEFLSVAAEFYGLAKPDVRALASRPLRVREGGWATELFGDYTPATGVIRIWTRTAVRKQVTSYGTFLSTLTHEFCHHLDCQRLGFRQSPHTRGFYQRAAVLYHHARGTEMKSLIWLRMPGGRWRIDWRRMRAAPSEYERLLSAKRGGGTPEEASSGLPEPRGQAGLPLA
jgi:hypothetical protein